MKTGFTLLPEMTNNLGKIYETMVFIDLIQAQGTESRERRGAWWALSGWQLPSWAAARGEHVKRAEQDLRSPWVADVKKDKAVRVPGAGRALESSRGTLFSLQLNVYQHLSAGKVHEDKERTTPLRQVENNPGRSHSVENVLWSDLKIFY